MGACINAALEQTDGTIHADGDIAAGDVKESSDPLVREPLVQTQLDNLAVGSWQEIDHFPKQDKQLPFRRKSFRVPSRGRMDFERILAATDLFSMELLRRGGDDPMNPRTGLRSAKRGMIEGLENLDPTGLKDIVGEIVVAGDPLEVLDRSQRAARSCDVFLAVGSSLVVEPAASLPLLAKQSGARLIILNRTETPLDNIADLVIRNEIGRTLPRLVEPF